MEPIELDGVEKSYGTVRALDGVSVTFEPGTVHAVIGPNGSGKTTLFRILLGLTDATSGTVSIPEATVGCGFQQPQVYHGLTVGENIRIFGSLVDAETAWVDDLIERCGIERLEGRIVGNLSDGLTKKLDFALAFVGEPDIVLLDEPFADIDDEAKPRLVEFLANYTTGDRLLVVSSHQLSLFQRVFDAVTVLHRGEVVLDERLSDIDDLETRGLTDVYVDLVG